MRSTILFAACAALAACGQSEPRSTVYFEAHPDEARRIVAGCKDGTVRGDECANADIAVQTLDGRERMRRFMGKD